MIHHRYATKTKSKLMLLHSLGMNMDRSSFFNIMSRLSVTHGSINLSQGVPVNDYDYLWKSSVCGQLEASWQYAPPSGTDSFSSCVKQQYLKDDENSSLTATSGCTESIICALFCLKEKGYKKIIFFEPFYSYYPGFAAICGMDTHYVTIDCRNGSINWDEVRLVCKRERSVILVNTPHNPTGYTLSETDESCLSRVLEETDCAIIIDEVYKDFIYEGKVFNYTELTGHNFLIASSWSKSLLGSGVRIGWLFGHKSLIERCQFYRMHLSNCSPAILESAAIEVFKKAEPLKDELREAYRARRNVLYKALCVAGFETIFPVAGHFIMARHDDLSAMNTVDQCVMLTKIAGVTPLPLDSFFHSYNHERWIRFSFSVATDMLIEASARLEMALS